MLGQKWGPNLILRHIYIKKRFNFSAIMNAFSFKDLNSAKKGLNSAKKGLNIVLKKSCCL
jgi:hypothetical protein